MAKTYWAFTLNNPTNDETVVDLERVLIDHVDYACFQLEQGKDGTIHYQGFCKLATAQRLSYVKKMLPRAHWEMVIAPKACRNYCMKADTRIQGPWELGTLTKSKQGKRTDIKTIYHRLKEGATIDTLLEQGIIKNNQQLRFAENILARELPKEEITDRTVIVLCGEPGTGKTYDARKQFPDAWISNNENGTVWYDGYQGQETVILDDFAGRLSKMSLTMLLRMLHNWEESMPVKGRFTLWKPKRIIITTNIRPEEWYDYSERASSWEALKRRINHLVIYYKLNNRIVKEVEEDFHDPRAEITHDTIDLNNL